MFSPTICRSFSERETMGKPKHDAGIMWIQCMSTWDRVYVYVSYNMCATQCRYEIGIVCINIVDIYIYVYVYIYIYNVCIHPIYI